LNLAEEIKRCGRPDIIVGVSRGGWLPARVLSDLLDNPNLANVRAEFYVGVAETKGEPTITQPVSMEVSGKNVLIVDEVADTGRSLELVKKHILKRGASEMKVATLYYKPWSVLKPDFFGKETDLWIVFPWEVKETIRKIMEKIGDQERLTRELRELIKAGVSAKLVDRLKTQIEEDNC
jgi:hypoxanthine phosphoribosyltransferase